MVIKLHNDYVSYVTLEKPIDINDFKSSIAEYTISPQEFVKRTINHSCKNYSVESLIETIFGFDDDLVWDIMEDDNCNTIEELVELHKKDNAINTLIDIFGFGELVDKLSESKVFKDDICEEFNAEMEKDFWERYEDYED